MIRRNLSQLAVYQTEEELNSIPFEYLQNLYMDKTSEIIYFTKGKQLYGIVCMQEVFRGKDVVKINKSFTVLQGGNMIQACRIFQSRKIKIHEIPIVNEQGELVGDYSCWDDILYIERNQKQFMQEENVKKTLGHYTKIYVVKPVNGKYSYFLQLTDYLTRFGIRHVLLDKEQIAGMLSDNTCFIFVDEDERRGTECLLRMEPYLYDIRGKYIYEYDMLNNMGYNVKWITYKSLLAQIIRNSQFEKIGIDKPDSIYCDLVDDKATVLLSKLNERGVKCFCLYDFEDKDKISEYCINFQKEVKERLIKFPKSMKKPWPKKDENPDFFGELYQYEDYEKEIVQQETCFPLSTFEYKNGIVGKYCNARNGRRVTCFQPKEYIGTIYTFGRCMMLGIYAEDQNTIASILQKKLIENGYAYRVENCADMLRSDCSIDERLQEIGSFCINDIIIFLSSPPNKVVNMQGMALETIYEKHKIPSTWVTDTAYGHCNYKVNQIVADEILEMIKPSLLNKTEISNEEEVPFSVYEEMKNYVKHKYLEYYFSNFNGGKYATVGAIVMECDPFSIEQSYWIEWAGRQVEFLIVFIIERDVLTFSFEERYRMAAEGTKAIGNVMVIPSGPCILSDITFREYFSGGEKRAVICNARYDINVFADYIAKPLHITHRFIGKESKREKAEIYNEEMKRILPQKGITVVEIPEMPQGKSICSSKVIAYLKNEEYDKAFELLPDSTKKYMIKHLHITK